jgi:hypothetical protein
MPNKLRRDKRGGTRKLATSVSKPFRKPHSVKEVLDRASPALTRLQEQADRQSYWKQWLAQHLPTELTTRLSGVVERDDTLVIFTESAAWSARLRYFLPELETHVKHAQPTIKQVSVRVMPKS